MGTITVTRPLKVIAFTCCFITVILMVAATSTADWMLADGWREGLFMQCISAGAETPLPFDMPEQAGCGAVRSASYLRGAAALVIIGLIFDFFGTFLTGLGLRSTDPNKKYKYYRVAIYALIIALIALLLAAIIYPVQFSKDLANEPPKDGGIVQAGSLDFDNDGLIDIVDEDDDNDGIPDDTDPDDDNDGIRDEIDNDDDNDGIPDDNDNPEDLMEMVNLMIRTMMMIMMEFQMTQIRMMIMMDLMMMKTMMMTMMEFLMMLRMIWRLTLMAMV